MFDTHEELVLLSEAASDFPGRPVHTSTLHRHRLRGVRGVKLECLRIGARWFTSKQAIARFIGKLNGNEPSASSSDTVFSRLSNAELDENLDRHGL